MAIAAAMARSIVASTSLRPSLALSLSKRHLTSASSSGNALRLRPSPISAGVRAMGAAGPARFMQVRCRMNRAGVSAYGSGVGGPEFVLLFSVGCTNILLLLFFDEMEAKPPIQPLAYCVVMENPRGEGATKQQMIDCYVKTLAKVLGSEEEAIQKIYNVSCERYFGFGCKIDEETSNKLKGLPGVLFVFPASYVDAEKQDYGAELFVNGQIVQRTPAESGGSGPSSDRPRYND